jgi:hypothetical protein
MRSRTLWPLTLLALAAACSSSTSPAADPITGIWAGKYDNGIQITDTLALTGSTISGRFNTGDSKGTVSGTYTSTTFTFLQTSTTGTQRTLTIPALVNSNTRITAHWDDGAGLNGAMCLAKSGSTACP